MIRRLVWSIAVLASAVTVGAQQPSVVVLDTPREQARLSDDAEALLAKPISVRLTDATLSHALDAVGLAAGVRLGYRPEVVESHHKTVTLRLSKVPLRSAIEQVLSGTTLQLLVLPKTQLAIVERSADAHARAADGIVRGTVRDSASGKGIAGATVSIRGTRLTAVTDANGHFSLPSVPTGDQVLTVRSLGYRLIARTIQVNATTPAELRIVLNPTATTLAGVVTTVTGIRRRVELGNDITTLNVDSIVKTTPVLSVANLLETRVPGLVATHTSGAPGDPVRIRLRGAASILENNDPIVILDGVRIYASQSDMRNQNLTAERYDALNRVVRVDAANPDSKTPTPAAAPSPLDQLDVNSIETIEVLKGPSAATLYGSDAANGVIVITTKRGRAGALRWNASATRGTTYMPNKYPDALWSFGHDVLYGTNQLCLITNPQCVVDSLVYFQALNDDRYTVLGRGHRTAGTLGVSGGSESIQYSLTGSMSDEQGLLKLPDQVYADFKERHPTLPVSGWMRRPQGFQQGTGTARVSAQLTRSADVSLTTMINRTQQQRSSLENNLAVLMRTYIDPVTGVYIQGSLTGSGPTTVPGTSQVGDLLTDFFRRTTDDALRSTTSAVGNWRVANWLTTSGDVGLDVLNREDESLTPRGYQVGADSVGMAMSGHGRSLVGSMDARATALNDLPLGWTLSTSVGANYSKTTTKDLNVTATGLIVGTTSPNGATTVTGFGSSSKTATFGEYLELLLSHQNVFLTAGIRADAGSNYGTRVKSFGMPKLGASWVVSEEPFFPHGVISTLRLRAAYGEAGVQPGATDQFRLYTTANAWYDGATNSISTISTSSFGDTQLQPERSKEFEGGLDADVFDGRISIGLTQYVKTRTNALITGAVPASVYGLAVSRVVNLGRIRNSGTEVTVGGDVLRAPLATLNVQFNLAHNSSRVLDLGPQKDQFNVPGSTSGVIRLGYPMSGIWARPVLGYNDTNQDGIITRDEVQLGDSSIYLGATDPDYTASLQLGVGLFHEALNVSAGFSYQGNLTQINRTVRTNQSFSAALNDPSASLGTQAAMAVINETNYGLVQTVSVLRFNSLSIAYRVPPSITRYLHTSAMTVAVQGTNLGLRSDYSGADPNVNAYGTGNSTQDTGILPTPRMWQLRVNVGY